MATPPLRLLVNHVGYDSAMLKRAIVQAPSPIALGAVRVISDDEGTSQEGRVAPFTAVPSWKQGAFASIDFSELRRPGSYRVVVESGAERLASEAFRIDEHLLIETAVDILFYFRGQRRTGAMARADAVARFAGDRQGTADVRGGWCDASADFAKNLSHLSYANFFNPQQTPLPAWILLEARQLLEGSAWGGADFMRSRLLDEAAWGADGLVRQIDPDGYFYANVIYNSREQSTLICDNWYMLHEHRDSYRAGLRQGAGVSIAALARAAADGAVGEFAPERYLETAVRAYDHLGQYNLEYLPDGTENIIDDYCGLLAATELARATSEPRFADAARRRAESLLARQRDGFGFGGWLRADGDARPFFHASDEGLPVVALTRWVDLFGHASDHDSVRAFIDRLARFRLAISEEVDNPFSYCRQLVLPAGADSPHSSFFMPHVNETRYWWQGENARLASIASELGIAKRWVDAELGERVTALGQSQLDWILGCNPYDACMLHGRGRNNCHYVLGAPNAPGGVYNGITSHPDDEADIAFLDTRVAADPAWRWRWAEQWIPHAAWLLLAVVLRDRA